MWSKASAFYTLCLVRPRVDPDLGLSYPQVKVKCGRVVILCRQSVSVTPSVGEDETFGLGDLRSLPNVGVKDSGTPLSPNRS